MKTQRVTIRCPNCRHPLDIRAEHLGRQGLCRFCGYKFRARADVVPSRSAATGRLRNRADSENGAGLGPRVRTLEFEFQELLTHLTLQTSQHMAALQELNETKARLRELEARERQAHAHSEPSNSAAPLMAWEVQVLDEQSVAASREGSAVPEPSATFEQPVVRLFEAPSSEAPVASGTDAQALSVPGDPQIIAERDSLRSAVESLRAELAERTAAFDRLTDERAAAQPDDRDSPDERVNTITSDLERQRAEREQDRAQLTEITNERDRLREELVALRAGHDRALEEARHHHDAERHGREDAIRDVTEERDALSQTLIELRARLGERDDAECQVETELVHLRERGDAERLEHTTAARGWATERDELERERVQLRERLEAEERARLDEAARHEHDRQRWEAERGNLNAETERALSEQGEQFEIERRSLQQQLDAGRGTEAEYQALRREAESLHQRLDAMRQERETAARRAEAAEYAVEEANALHARTEAERERLESELHTERTQRLDDRAQAVAAQEAASQSAEEQADTLRAEIDRLNRALQARRDEHGYVLSALQRESDRERHALEDQLAAARGEATQLRGDLDAAVREGEQRRAQSDDLAHQCEGLKERLVEVEAARLRDEDTRASEARQAEEANTRAQDALRENLRAAEAQVEVLRTELERHGQEHAALGSERDGLRERLGQLETARGDTEAQVRAVVEQLRTTALNAVRAREETQRQLDEMRQERDRLAAEVRDHTESSQETVRKLAAVLAQLSQFQVPSNPRKVELIDQVRLLNGALAGESPEAPAESPSRMSEPVASPVGPLDDEIHAAAELARLNHAAALSELDEDVVFGIDENEYPDEA